MTGQYLKDYINAVQQFEQNYSSDLQDFNDDMLLDKPKNRVNNTDSFAQKNLLDQQNSVSSRNEQ
jgi:hypothetical protein